MSELNASRRSKYATSEKRKEAHAKLELRSGHGRRRHCWMFDTTGIDAAGARTDSADRQCSHRVSGDPREKSGGMHAIRRCAVACPLLHGDGRYGFGNVSRRCHQQHDPDWAWTLHNRFQTWWYYASCRCGCIQLAEDAGRHRASAWLPLECCRSLIFPAPCAASFRRPAK